MFVFLLIFLHEYHFDLHRFTLYTTLLLWFILPHAFRLLISALLSTFIFNGMAQVHETVVGEEVEEAKDVGEMGSQTKAEKSVTGESGLKEYEYSYKDDRDRAPEGEPVGDVGHALAAVTDEGGVSHVL